jgi:hypothetical protein
MVDDNSKNIVGFLRCLSLFESKTATLYSSIAEKVDLPLVKSLFMEISLDSQKHAGLLHGISESLPKSSWNPSECAKKVGEAWNATEIYTREITKKEKIDVQDFPELLEHLDTLEGFAGEEYNVFIQMKTLELLSDEIKKTYNINLEGFKGIFVGILQDEEHNREVIALIKELINKKEQEMNY